MHGFRDLQDCPLAHDDSGEGVHPDQENRAAGPSVPGTALANDKTGEVIYTPSVGEGLLRDLLTNWERFLHKERDLAP